MGEKKKATMAKATISKVRKGKGGTDVTSLSKRRRRKKNEKMLEQAKWQQSCNRGKKNPAAKIATHPKRANKTEAKKPRIVEPEIRATKSTKVDKQKMLRNTHQREILPPIRPDTWGEKWTKVNIKKKSHQKA